jgi:hypothetical protein
MLTTTHALFDGAVQSAPNPKSRFAKHPIGSLIDCDVCEKTIVVERRKQKRCIGCRAAYHLRWDRQNRNKTPYPVGSEFPCAKCGVLTIKMTCGHRNCEDCAGTARAKRRAIYLASKERPIATIGAEIKCQGCGAGIIRLGAKQKWCEGCKRQKQLASYRACAEKKRRAAGMLPVKGTEAICSFCSAPFIRRGIKHQFCDDCGPNLWKKCPRRRLDLAFGNQIRKALGKSKAGQPWETLVGYTLSDLKRHIERQFSKGMTWENYGDWHIDHIIPRCSFVYASPDDAEFIAAWAITNLRPLWSSDNHIKSGNRTLLL